MPNWMMSGSHTRKHMENNTTSQKIHTGKILKNHCNFLIIEKKNSLRDQMTICQFFTLILRITEKNWMLEFCPYRSTLLLDIKGVTLATLYGECRLLNQNFLMPPSGRVFGTEKNPIYIYFWFISQPPIQHPNVDKPKSRYISDIYQL